MTSHRMRGTEMLQCPHTGCRWHAIAPSKNVALRRYAEHIVDEHSTAVDADVPEGMVQVRLRRDGPWITTTRERARELHDALHEDGR